MSIEKNTKNTLSHEDGGFTTLINETIQNIKHTGALGVYCYLASKPSGFEICKEHLQNHFGCGREHIETCFKILKSLGAMEVNIIRSSTGQIEGWETILKRKINIQTDNSDQNTGNPYSGDSSKLSTDPVTRIRVSQNLGKPESGKPAPINKAVNNKRKIIKKQKNNNKEDPPLNPVVKPPVQKPVIVFSCSEELKTFLLQVLSSRSIELAEDLQNQILWYLRNSMNSAEALKKINIALKMLRERRWNIPHGYMPVADEQLIRAREIRAEEQKRQEINAAKSFKQVLSTMSFKDAKQRDEAEMKRLGLSANDYYRHVLSQARRQSV